MESEVHRYLFDACKPKHEGCSGGWGDPYQPGGRSECTCPCHTSNPVGDDPLYTQSQVDTAIKAEREANPHELEAVKVHCQTLRGRIAFMLKALELAWPRITWRGPKDAAAIVIQDALETGRRTAAEKQDTNTVQNQDKD